MTSRQLVPIDPVDPRTTTRRRGVALGSADKRHPGYGKTTGEKRRPRHCSRPFPQAASLVWPLSGAGNLGKAAGRTGPYNTGIMSTRTNNPSPSSSPRSDFMAADNLLQINGEVDVAA